MKNPGTNILYFITGLTKTSIRNDRSLCAIKKVLDVIRHARPWSGNLRASSGLIILCMLTMTWLNAVGQSITISGYIQDADTKEALIGANIYETRLRKGTATNQYGFYSITLQASDTLNLIFSFIGYKPEGKKIVSKANLRIDIVLLSAGLLDEVEINASRNDDNVNRSQMGVIDVP